MKANSPLQALRDIHLPPPISFWPPALGWYLLALVIIVVGMFIGISIIKYLRRTKARRIALEELNLLEKEYLQNNNAEMVLSTLSQLLRRVALAYYPRKKVAGLHGERWLEFLDETGKSTTFQTEGSLLAKGPYQKEIIAELTGLISICKHWIRGQ